MRSPAILLALLLSLVLGEARAADPLKVFAAASLTDALTDVLQHWQEERGETAVPVLAASSTLAKQITNGAPADLFISASEAWMDALEAAGDLEPGTRIPLLGNALVLIVPSDSRLRPRTALSATVREVLAAGRIAVGDPDHVPAGLYAKASLDRLGLWAEVEPHLARTADVRGALALVARGEAAAGIVYATDAEITGKVRTLLTFPEESHPPIVYPAAVLRGGDRERSAALLDYLAGSEAGAIFQRYGFLSLAASRKPGS